MVQLKWTLSSLFLLPLFLLSSSIHFKEKKDEILERKDVLKIEPKKLYKDSLDYFADNGFGKPFQSIQHPMGEYYNGITYVAYQGPNEDPYVCSYNHKLKEWKGPFKAGKSSLGKKTIVSDPENIDNHGRPALIVDNNGFIHLVFGGHGGSSKSGKNEFGFSGSGEQTHVISKKPFDISQWEVLPNISPFGTYSQWIKTNNGNIYLFYRHGPHRSDWVYQKSSDNALTFSKPFAVLKHKKASDNSNTYDSWYAWFHEGANNSIVATFNYHICGSSKEHTSLRINAYAMKMNTKTESWETMVGEKLNMPLTKESADEYVKIYDSKGRSARLGTILTDDLGNANLYFRKNTKEEPITFARWNGNKWSYSNLMGSKYGFIEGDLLIEEDAEIRYISALKNIDSNEISWWNSKDKGQTWTKENPIMSSLNGKYVMSSLIRNSHPDARVLVAEIPNIPNSIYSRVFLVGENGPVKR